MTMNRREGALSTLADRPRPLPLRKNARSPFVPVLVQPLDLTNPCDHEAVLRLHLVTGQHLVTDAIAPSVDIVSSEDEARFHATAFCFFACSIRAAQMNPASSRATATLALLTAFPRSLRRR